MKKRIGFVVACVAALGMCSCANQADLEKLKADAAAARAEAAEAKAAAAEAKTTADALKTKLDAEEKAKADEAAAKAKAAADALAAKEKAAKLESELRDRWNQVGPKYTVGNFGAFRWPGPNAFPHPTFKGGSKEAYTEFAKALVEFLETGDNFEFMQKNNLFTVEIGFGGTGKIKLGEFAEGLARPNSLGSNDEANRKKLEALVAKMKAPRKV